VTDPRSTNRWAELCRALRPILPPVCWICGGDIDRTLPAKNKWSWTLDHVVPLAQRPELAFDESNLRPAHMWCNAKRGNGTSKPDRMSRKW
jgi:5-methylcytosine-specific restriction endonuclease McrA